MPANLKVGIVGAAGRMGRTLIEAACQDESVEMVAAVDIPGCGLIGRDAGTVAGIGESGVALTASLEACLADIDVVIDFTQALASIENIRACLGAGTAMVVGTTGFSANQRAEIDRLAENAAIVLAPNMSVGVNVCFKLVEVASRALGDEVDIEIIEAHHRHKVDGPSGTAVRLGEIVAGELGRDLAQCAIYGREGHTGPRDRQTIGFETIRAGDIVGEHTVMFAGVGERIEIVHRAGSRMNFAMGALRAARWIRRYSSGRYDMQDVLGLR